MSDFRDAYSTIRSELAYAYWEPNDARVLIQDAQIDATKILWSGRPYVLWNEILLQAMRENKIETLLDQACYGKPDLENLKTRFLETLTTWDRKIVEEKDEKLPFPLRRDFLDIVSAFKNGILVPVLGPSVNPAIYVDLAASLVELVAGQELSDVKEQQDFVRNHFGSPCSICHFLPTLRPEMCPVLAGVPRNPPCSVYNEQMLTVAKANCRSLSQLYEIRETTPALYAAIEPCIIKASGRPNQIYRVLGRLIKKWPEISAANEPGQPRKVRPALPYPLIITSNWDTGLERVFSQEQIPYDLVWCVASGAKKGKWMYQRGDDNEKPAVINIKGKGPTFRIGEPHGSDPKPRVIILKVFGTIRDATSGRAHTGYGLKDDFFVITQDQMEFFQSRGFDKIPEDLTSVLKQFVKILFLGFSPNDPDLRAIIHRLCGDEGLTGVSWLVHQCDAGKLDQEIWSKRGNARLIRVDESLEQTMIDLERGISDVSRTVTV